MPDPVYPVFVERRKLRLKAFRHRSPVIEIEITVRRLAGRPCVTRLPATPSRSARNRRTPRLSEYRRRHPDRRYAVSKRR